MFSTQKFREYIIGKTIVMQTDLKPLETILHKPTIAAPLKLQSMILKVSGYDLMDPLSQVSLNEEPL